MKQDMKLSELREVMKREHSFNASKTQYETQFRRWGWRKNLTQSEWEYLGKHITKRKKSGKASEVIFNGHVVPSKKVNKEISRHCLPKFTSVSSPPTPLDIIIRTPRILSPGPNNSWEKYALQESMPPLMSQKRKRDDTDNIPSRGRRRRGEPSAQSTSLGIAPPVSVMEDSSLPFHVFADFMESLDFEIDSRPLLVGNFFDSAQYFPSYFIDIPVHAEDHDTELFFVDSLDRSLQDSTSEGRFSGSFDGFYESFASILIPSERYEDRLDANMELQQRLPSLLANMPERKKGEIQSFVDILLGPPGYHAGLCMLEVVVYMFSNGFVLRHDSNPIFQWIVDRMPSRTLSAIFRTEIPTLRQFQSTLLLYAIKTSHIFLVSDLMELETSREEVANCSKYLAEAVRQNNLEMVELLLASGSQISSTGGRSHLAICLVETVGVSVDIAQALSARGYKFDEMYRSESPCTAAIKRGEFQLAQYLINIGAQSADSERHSLPVLAVCSGQIDILYLILGSELGSNLDSPFQPNYPSHWWPLSLPPKLYFTGTALQIAAATGMIEMAKLLLGAGANINEPPHGRDGMSALQASVKFEHVETTKLLLKNGANPNAMGSKMLEFPGTALLVAVEKNNIYLVRLLLDFGANPNTVVLSDHGTTILEVARAQVEGCAITSLLVNAGAEESFESTRFQKERCMKLQLPRAVLKGDIKKVQHLVKMGVKVDMKPIEIGWSTEPLGAFWNKWHYGRKITILHCAMMPKNECIHLGTTLALRDSIFVYLVKQIPDINGNKDSFAVEPILFEAVSQGKHDMVEFILDAGADINVISDAYSERIYECFTALHTAIFYGDIRMIKLLLDRGADINLRTPSRPTPLQCSLAYPRNPTTEILLACGADIRAPRIDYEFTLLQTAVVRTAIDGDPKVIALVNRLVSIVNIDEFSRDGETALTIAASRGNLDLVNILLDNGANVNAVDAVEKSRYLSRTALEAAASEGHIKIAEALIAKGACVNFQKSHRNESALGLAVALGRLDMVQFLINAGADLHLPLTTRYSYALKLAKENGYFGIVSILQKYRDEAMEEWRQIRLLEMDSGDEREEY
ncbi:hypothetical protein HYFRA_00003558 [Hymenoscyphus fraxineus]|uniref:Clr5 domain-containing protein n=1 Tax=Hymenoscyphus fraxineus TaxID=746836 RepID=A0A9N9PTC2_9HELO|nr:hypothetical protein HYFRA_00003558 [Hymenoscyphus fraxineus]